MSVSASASHRDARRWRIFAIVVAAQFLAVVDAFIVNIAIPTIQSDLGAGAAEAQGVIVLYMLAVGAFVVTGGRLGDIHGARRLFILGLAGFTLASLWCGLARSGGELVLARGVQGLGGALMVPQVLATIHRLFDGEERGRAFGLFGATLGLGGAVGFGAGGVIVSMDIAGLGWRAIFLVNVPIGLVLLVAAIAFFPRDGARGGARLDLSGAGLLFLALLGIVTPVMVGGELGWPAWLGAVMAGGVLALWGFARHIRRLEGRGGAPLLSPQLLATPRLSRALTAVGCFTFANLSFYLVASLYMQSGLGLTAMQAGVAALPLALAFIATSRVAGPRAQAKGPSALIEGCWGAIAALLLIALALPLCRLVDGPARTALAAVILAPFGIGQGMVMAPLFGYVLASMPQEHAGAGAGMLSTIQQLGNAVGVAAIGALYFGVAAALSTEAALAAAAALLALGFLATLIALRPLGAASGRPAPA